MSRLLQWLFGRLPVGWLQLTHSRTRFAAALAGVAFANVLVFVQLGIMNSMATATLKPYEFFQADIMISASDANSMAEGGNVARQWLFQALADPDVTAGTGLYIANVSWARATKTLSLTTYGIDPTQPEFLSPVMARKSGTLQLQNAGILDMLSRGLPREEAAAIRPQTPTSFEVSGTTLTLYDTFLGGGGFGGDGYMLVSDQTFITLFPARSSAAPDHILLKTARGVDPEAVATRLRELISDKTVRIRTYEQAAAEDLSYQQTKRPTGIIFGFGVIIGILVGIVIVYQVLSTDVADHLSEYATFKAMGYPQRFFLGIVFEEALILAVFGFVPGFAVATGLLAGMNKATGLPLAMTGSMAVMVFFGTLIACSISGAIATRRLASADPADLFKAAVRMPEDFPIAVSGLNHWFGTGEARKQAIFDVDLQVKRGSLTVLMGPSGSGKTTVLTLMGCLRDVQEGSINLLGHELSGARDDLNEALRRRLGFIFQAHNLHGSLTAVQNVLMGLQVHGQTENGELQAAARHSLSLVGLADRLDYLPANLSGGQKQRVAVARALVGNPDVVFADEPTAALDSESGMNVVRMLKKLGEMRGTTTVMVTHDNRILELADRIVTLEDGRIVRDSPP